MSPDPEPDHVPEPMAGLPVIEQLKKNMQAAVRGDDAWRHPDMVIDDEESYRERHHDEPVNGVAPTPEIYTLAHQFMVGVFGEDNYTPDSVGQLVDVFVPCLRIMNDKKQHPWPEDGALWRRGGMLPVMIFMRAKFMRYWERTWVRGIRHDDSGYDFINFAAFTLRAEPEDKWGELGEPHA